MGNTSTGMDWGGLLQTGLQFAGGQGASRGQAALQKQAAEEEQRRYEARKEAYQNMIGGAKGDFSTGESQFMTEANTANPELAKMENQITGMGSQALQDTAGQINLANTQQGVRGGAGATQLRRGLGEVGTATLRDINKMKYDESATRAGERRAYTAGKARAGQTATYTPPTF